MAPGGPTADKATFTKVVMDGRPDRGMPAFKDIVTPEQIGAMHAYLKGRAEKQIPAGRPKELAEEPKKETPG
jgi:mono/diheme cytochrome c family protein